MSRGEVVLAVIRFNYAVVVDAVADFAGEIKEAERGEVGEVGMRGLIEASLSPGEDVVRLNSL